MPVRPVEEVDEVDPEGLLGLPDLPVLPAACSFLVFAECAYLVGQWRVCGGPRQELTHPPHDKRRRLGADQLALEQEFPELLQR